MRSWKLVVLSALLGACNCDGNNGGSGSDAGADMAEANDMAQPGDDAGEMGGDGGAVEDMAMLPDGVSIPGQSADVTVKFDERGIPHIACTTYEDCLAAQGYYHAADRFLQMDVQRRFATGRLAGLIGNAALSTDIATRTILSTSMGQPLEEYLWEHSAEATKSAITAYARGVNAWIEDYHEGRNGAELSSEYELEIVDPTILPWTETDSIAVGILLAEQLSNSADSDIRHGAQYAGVTAEQAFDILGTMNGVAISTMGSSGETYSRALTRRPDANRLRSAQDRLRPHRSLLMQAASELEQVHAFLGAPDVRGSNNWVISGALTTSGMPILANDPHLALLNPTLWYLVTMRSEDGFVVAGASLPGMPGIELGHNENIAWGATVLFHDLADAYVEELSADGSKVTFEGAEVDIIEVEHTFPVARSQPQTRTLRFVPHHGPIVAYDADARRAISVRWAGHEVQTDLDMFFDLSFATNVAEARAAFTKVATINMNWVVADRAGDIGWFPFTAVPERPWASLDLPPWLPLPGDGSAEWGPPIPIDEQPQMTNPANGYIVTANTDPTGTSFDGDPTNEAYGYQYSFGETGGFRQRAIVDRVEAVGDMHTAADSIDIQGDTYMVLADLLLPAVRAAVESDIPGLTANGQALWSALDTWDGTCPTGLETSDPTSAKSADGASASIGCTALHYLVTALTEEVFGDELAGSGASATGLGPIRTLVILANDPMRLMGGDVYWDDIATDTVVETQTDTLRAGLEVAAGRLVASHGADPDEWRWGRLHTLRMYSNVFSDAGFFQYEAGPFAAPGGAFTINVANPNGASSEDWRFSSGPSFRHVSEFGTDGITSHWTLPGGQRHHRESPLYNSLVDDWIDVRPFAMPFTPAAIDAAATETVTVLAR